MHTGNLELNSQHNDWYSNPSPTSNLLKNSAHCVKSQGQAKWLHPYGNMGAMNSYSSTCLKHTALDSVQIRLNIILFSPNVVAQRSVGCFQQHLFVCLCVCQYDNFRTSKHKMMKLGGRWIVPKSWPCSNGGHSPPGCTPPKMWHWATTLGKSEQAV